MLKFLRCEGFVPLSFLGEGPGGRVRSLGREGFL